MNYLNPELLTRIADPVLMCQLMEDTDLRLEIDLTQQCDHIPRLTKGSIPNWLNGNFVRNCPMLVTNREGESMGHWFDGPSMLFGFHIEDQTVKFSNRYLRSIAYEKIVHEETVNFPGFESYSHHTFWQKTFNFLFKPAEEPTNIIQNANVNVWKFGDEVVALTETPLPVRVDPTSLTTLGALDYDDDLPKSNVWESAHPHLDPETGDTINFLVQFGYETFYVVYRVAAGTKTRQEIGRVKVDKAAYMHHFSITEQYVIFVESPLVASALDFLLRDTGFIQHYEWEPQRGTVFILMNRATGHVEHRIKCEDSFFTFHHVNAYESENEIVLDLILYADNSIINAARTKKISGERTANIIPSLRRFHINLIDANICASELHVEDVEFPRINDAFNGKPYRFAYMVDFRDELHPNDELQYLPLYKIDLITQNRLMWYEADCVCDEPVFVAAPTKEAEDDGVVLSIVSNQKTRSSFLLMLDAKTFIELNRTELPLYVPRGLHARFFER